jgi:hypothetical protein
MNYNRKEASRLTGLSGTLRARVCQDNYEGWYAAEDNGTYRDHSYAKWWGTDVRAQKDYSPGVRLLLVCDTETTLV